MMEGRTNHWRTGKSKEKNWLIWRKEQPADFILRLEFRWDKGISGVQVRSDDPANGRSSAIRLRSPQRTRWAFGTIPCWLKKLP